MNQTQNYRRVPNLNLIPVEFQNRLFSRRLLSLRLLLAVLIGLAVLGNALLYQEHLAIRAATDASQKQIEQTNTRLTAADMKRENAAKIQAEIDTLQREAVSLKEDFRGLQDGQGWPQALSDVFSAKIGGIALIAVAKQGTNNLVISGNATSYSALLAYRNQLLASNEIARIISLASEKEGDSFSFSIIAQVDTGVRQ